MTDELEVQADEQSSDQPLSVREELTNALQESKERTESTEAERPAKSRDESGKFARKAESEAGFPEKQTATAEVAEITVTQEKPAVAAPHSWSAAAKAKWGELPADIQAEVSRREEEVHKGFTRQDEERNFGKSLKEVITPYMPMITSEGGNPAAAVQSLLNTAYRLRTGTPQQKGQLIEQLAKQFGADMTQTNSSAAYVDPQVQTLQQRLDVIEQQRQQEINQRETRQQESINTEIDTFASDPAHPHYETVKAHMAALLRGGVATDLKDAYDQAVYARPDIRSTLLAQQHADSEAKRLADIKAKTQAARNASSSVTGAPGISVANKGAPERSLRDELKANFRGAIN